MGVGVWDCMRISCAEIVLVTIFRNGSPCSGTVCVCGSVSCPWHKHIECHAELSKHCLILLYRISHLQGGYRHSKWKNINCQCT